MKEISHRSRPAKQDRLDLRDRGKHAGKKEMKSSSPRPSRQSSFLIADIPIYGDVILAPMAGFADVPMRAIARRFGSAINYTEFVAAEDILTRNKRKLKLFDFKGEAERPMVFQIFSNSAETLLAAAQKIAHRHPDIIDINMGCSTRRVSGRGAGVGMMKRPLEVAKTFELLTKNLPMPITGKIRLGWDGAENYLEIGRIMQESGAAMLAIHPRTKEQKYGGKARWEAIAELKQQLTIPVIGNGDIQQPADIDKMLAYTGCDAVMIGRAAIGNPWLLARRDRAAVTQQELFDLILLHVREMVAYHGERGILLFRKHLKRYLGGGMVSAEIQTALLTTSTLAQFETLLMSVAPFPQI
ncbi:MAG TPA: tRNA-dihydrouridine synthase family protein [Anaerolineae bacterium]|nr:tRNA-dihydrouridine synthase family protein [Anaerolineae bacterium]